MKTLRQSLKNRSAGLLWVTCMGVIGHLLQLKVHLTSLCRVGIKTNSACFIVRKGISYISNSASDGKFVFISLLIVFNGTRVMWWSGIVTMFVDIKHIFCSVLFCSSVDIFKEAIANFPRSFVFKELAIFLPLHMRNNFPLIFQSILILYLWAKFNPKINCCFNLVHTQNYV